MKKRHDASDRRPLDERHLPADEAEVESLPRCVHERVLHAINGAGPRLVVLDISFRPRAGASTDDHRVDEAQDRALAREIAAAGHVLAARRFDLVPRPEVREAHARRDFFTTPSELSAP